MMIERDETAPPLLPARDERGHKGTFGTVVVVGGCDDGEHLMIGAPALSARAALRAGCGLVKVLAPNRVLMGVLGLCPSATGRVLAMDGSGRPVRHQAAEALDELLAGLTDGSGPRGAMVVGPGLGGADGVGEFVLRACSQDEVPVVLDADGLNSICGVRDFWLDLRAPLVLTPHPGEFRRLASALGIDADPVDPARRAEGAASLARRLGAVVVLKGAGTVVTDGIRAWTSDAADPVLATAGTGDVLAGLIGGLIAQHARTDALSQSVARARAAMAPGPNRGGGSRIDPGGSGAGSATSIYDLCRIGVQAHGFAAARWRAEAGAEAGMLAQELADALPMVLAGLRAGGVGPAGGAGSVLEEGR